MKGRQNERESHNYQAENRKRRGKSKKKKWFKIVRNGMRQEGSRRNIFKLPGNFLCKDRTVRPKGKIYSPSSSPPFYKSRIFLLLFRLISAVRGNVIFLWSFPSALVSYYFKEYNLSDEWKIKKTKNKEFKRWGGGEAGREAKGKFAWQCKTNRLI